MFLDRVARPSTAAESDQNHLHHLINPNDDARERTVNKRAYSSGNGETSNSPVSLSASSGLLVCLPWRIDATKST